jgi:hypothetical protein
LLPKTRAGRTLAGFSPPPHPLDSGPARRLRARSQVPPPGPSLQTQDSNISVTISPETSLRSRWVFCDFAVFAPPRFPNPSADTWEARNLFVSVLPMHSASQQLVTVAVYLASFTAVSARAETLAAIRAMAAANKRMRMGEAPGRWSCCGSLVLAQLTLPLVRSLPNFANSTSIVDQCLGPQIVL